MNTQDRKIWIFQGDRMLTETEVENIQSQLDTFISQWFSHGDKLKAQADVEEDLFIIIRIDESAFQASGCSIDKMTHFIRDIGIRYKVDFFNRMKLALEIGDRIHLVELNSIKDLISQGLVSKEVKIYDHLIQNERELANKWCIPITQSWANRFIEG